MNIHHQATKIFPNMAKEQNKNTFGNIFKRKKKDIAILDGIQNLISNIPNILLLKRESAIKMDFFVIIEQEEKHLAMKFRTK